MTTKPTTVQRAPKAKAKVVVTVNLRAATLATIDALAAGEGVSRSAIVNRLLARAVSRMNAASHGRN